MKAIQLFFLLNISFLIFSCNKSNNQSVSFDFHGKYEGFFMRQGKKVPVQLSMDAFGFSGNSDDEQFPAICGGTFKQKEHENIIVFYNDCLYTADFDWTLKLDGEWKYIIEDNKIILTRENGDQYILEKIDNANSAEKI